MKRALFYGLLLETIVVITSSALWRAFRWMM